MTSLPATTTTHVPTPVRPDGTIARPPGVGPAATGGFGARQFFNLLLRHFWLVVGLFLFAQAATWGAFALCYRYGKEYTARGQMVLSEKREVGQEARPWEKYMVETRQREQALRLLSEENLRMLLGQPDAAKWRWFQAHRNERPNPVDYLREHAVAAHVRDSTLVELRVRDRDPKAAAEIVDKLMEFYAQRTREDALRQTTEDRRALNMELEKVEFSLTRADTSLAQLRQSPDYEGLEKARIEVIDRVAQLVSLETQAELYEQQAKRMAEAIPNPAAAPDSPPSAEVVRVVESNSDLLQMLARRRAWMEELVRLHNRGLGEEHPDIKDANARIRQVDEMIRAKRAELIDRARQAEHQQAQAAYESAKAHHATIRVNLEAARASKRSLEAMWAKARSLEQERDLYEKQQQRLKDRIREVDMRISRGMPQMEVFVRASEPQADEYSFPRWELFLPLGLVGGLLLSIGIAVLIELVDTSVRTPRDLSEHVRMPLLGFVPHVEASTLSRREICRLAAAEPMSLVSESFRQIRTNLLFAAPVDQLGSLAITSAARDEGKTTVAANLAITIALSGRRVLLVDANFRRPALAEAFGLTGTIGLSNLLTNQATLAEAAQPTDVPNLTVVPTGPTPPNPAELMGSATMRTFLDQADAEYDLVLFDAPPALLVSDALVLGTMVDGVVAVVRAGQTSRGMVSRLRDQLNKVRARLVGAVLNAARSTRGGYFRKSQQQYEDYHSLSA